MPSATHMPWHFKNGEPNWRLEAMYLPCNAQKTEEEKHGYRRENCPSGYNYLSSWSRTSKPFDPRDSIDTNSKCIPWRFKFGDDMFRCNVFGLPPGVHFKEEEFHNWEKSEGVYTPPRPEPCPSPPPCPSPTPVREQPKPCLPKIESGPTIEPPIPSRGVLYPNVLGERDWHAVNRQTCDCGELVDQSEFSHYERNVKTCDPCLLPQRCDGRMFKLPRSNMRPNEADRFKSTNLPRGELLPKIYKYTEDEGHCDKRTTNGPGKYTGSGFYTRPPIAYLECLPFGYHCSEQQSQTFVEKTSAIPENPCISYCYTPYPEYYCPPPPCPPSCDPNYYVPCDYPVCVPCQ